MSYTKKSRFVSGDFWVKKKSVPHLTVSKEQLYCYCFPIADVCWVFIDLFILRYYFMSDSVQKLEVSAV